MSGVSLCLLEQTKLEECAYVMHVCVTNNNVCAVSVCAYLHKPSLNSALICWHSRPALAQTQLTESLEKVIQSLLLPQASPLVSHLPQLQGTLCCLPRQLIYAYGPCKLTLQLAIVMTVYNILQHKALSSVVVCTYCLH